MPVTFDPPALTAITEVVSAAAQTEILGLIDDEVIPYLTGQTDTLQNVTPSPDYDKIPPATATKLVGLLEALKTAIDAAPTS